MEYEVKYIREDGSVGMYNGRTKEAFEAEITMCLSCGYKFTAKAEQIKSDFKGGNDMDNDERKYKELKRELFIWGNDYIEEFLGYSDDVDRLSKDEIENLMDEAYAQMPDDVLEEFFEKFNIK